MNTLPAPTADDRAAWSHIDAADLRARAEADLGTPWPQPLASQAARVHRDGDRVAWENPAFARQHRLSRAVVAAAATLDEQWIDEVIDGVQLLCEQSSWCWPAHDDTFDRRGSVLATVTDPFLDLGAGEVVAQLAWIDHVLGTQLDARAPGIRSRIRHEAQRRVFDPFVERRDWHWLGLDGDVHNWNPWIHSAVLTAAVQLHEHPDHIIDLVVEGLDRYLVSLPDDGAIDEGYSYWWNGACRALEALDLLEYATDRSRRDLVGLRETVAFPHRCHLGGDWYANLADGQARPPADLPWHALHRAARRIGDADAAAHAASHRAAPPSEFAGLGRLVQELTDAGWLAAAATASPLPRDVWLPSTQVLLARERAGSAAGLGLVVKGGHNAEHHNHNDVGSFIVTSDGVPVIVDAGRPTYTKATFGPDRYSIWTMQSSWHNTPTVAGVDQSPGREFAASEVEASVTDAVSSLSLDLGAAYALDGLTWRRTAALDRAERVVRVSDAWDGPLSDSPTTLNLVVAGTVSARDDGIRVAPLDGATPVVIRWAAGIRSAHTVRLLDDPMLSDVWGERLTRIELDVSAHDRAWITVERDDATPGTGDSEDDR
ncbi:heparinase II/III family protein [Microbacterium sp. WCS2018Hpa-23]|uniref:heparinase II/III domain-containing protein n=1 Tax=Microbacterium sp. WCS2018Hpa-23 TaxID=3073634 RepID=UPI002882E5E9|nr:heparinase II/III family protein [Microbacterium sp. WCS2018Hpa-23]